MQMQKNQVFMSLIPTLRAGQTECLGDKVLRNAETPCSQKRPDTYHITINKEPLSIFNLLELLPLNKFISSG